MLQPDMRMQHVRQEKEKPKKEPKVSRKKKKKRPSTTHAKRLALPKPSGTDNAIPTSLMQKKAKPTSTLN